MRIGEIASRTWARTPQNTMNLRNILHGPISYNRMRTRIHLQALHAQGSDSGIFQLEKLQQCSV